MRAAIYFTPPRDHPLTRAAAIWLGRDAYGEAATNWPGFSEIAPDAWASLTSAPRRYGFHATMKAPFSLARGRSLADLDAALQAYGTETPPVELPPLKLARLGAFFALVPDAPCPDLQMLAGDVVRNFDDFRAAPTEVELTRRLKGDLSETQTANIRRWGYPHVFDEFRFHMTLTGPVAESEQDAIEALLRWHFAAFLGKPLPLDCLALFLEPQGGADFTVFSRHALRCP